MVITSVPSRRASAFLIDNLLKETVAESKAVCSPPTSPPVHPAFRDSKQTTVVTLESACVERELRSDSDSSSGCSSPELTSPYGKESHDKSESRVMKKKKNRTSFTNYQLQQLELTYRRQRYLPADERTLLSRRLKLSDQQVKTWFQNRRMKEKRMGSDTDVTSSVSMTTSAPVTVLPQYGFNPSLLSPLAVQFNGFQLPSAAVPSGGLAPYHGNFSQPYVLSVPSVAMHNHSGSSPAFLRPHGTLIQPGFTA